VTPPMDAELKERLARLAREWTPPPKDPGVFHGVLIIAARMALDHTEAKR
jgi:hypothetical protein